MCFFTCYTTASPLHLFHSDSALSYHPHSSLSKLLNILQNATRFHYPFTKSKYSLWAMNVEWRIPTGYSCASQIRNSKSPIERGFICVCCFFFLTLTYTSFPSRNSWILISCQVILLSCHCECKTAVPASYFFYPAPYFFSILLSNTELT